MITKYKTGGYYGSGQMIKEVQIDKETDKSIWIGGRRRSKESSYYTYHDSWDLARDHLMSLAEISLENARVRLQKAQSHLGNVKGLKP